MDLNQHKEIILTWINSCETVDQLVLAEDVVERFVKERFKGQVNQIDLILVVSDLRRSITDREKQVIVEDSAMRSVPTLAYQKNK